MTLKQINFRQKKIAKTLQTRVHPDNPLALEMNRRYRELEILKEEL